MKARWNKKDYPINIINDEKGFLMLLGENGGRFRADQKDCVLVISKKSDMKFKIIA